MCKIVYVLLKITKKNTREQIKIPLWMSLSRFYREGAGC